MTVLASAHLTKVKAGIQILHENMTGWNSHFIPNEKVTLKIMQVNTRNQCIMCSLNRNGETHTNPPTYLLVRVKHSHDLVVSVLSIISFVNAYERQTLPGYLSLKVTMIFFNTSSRHTLSRAVLFVH